MSMDIRMPIWLHYAIVIYTSIGSSVLRKTDFRGLSWEIEFFCWLAPQF